MNDPEIPKILSWEDEAAGSGRWWLARAHDDTADGRVEYFIVADDETPTHVAVVLAPKARAYRVIAVAPFPPGEAAAALAGLKDQVSRWRAGTLPQDWDVLRWRLARIGRLIIRHVPLVLAGFAGGALLGVAVAMAALLSHVTGSAMILAGIVIGAVAGPGLKALVDRGAGPGPWARFAVAVLAGAAGAAAGAGTMFALYWN